METPLGVPVNCVYHAFYSAWILVSRQFFPLGTINKSPRREAPRIDRKPFLYQRLRQPVTAKGPSRECHAQIGCNLLAIFLRCQPNLEASVLWRLKGAVSHCSESASATRVEEIAFLPSTQSDVQVPASGSHDRLLENSPHIELVRCWSGSDAC